MRWQRNRLYRPRAGTWSSLSWPVWLVLACALIAWQVIDGSYISAAIFVLLLGFAAVLRVRERRSG